MKQLIMADIIVIGTSSMSRYLKAFIDRFADPLDDPLAGNRIYRLVQGTEPECAISYITNGNTSYLSSFPHEIYGVSN